MLCGNRGRLDDHSQCLGGWLAVGLLLAANLSGGGAEQKSSKAVEIPVREIVASEADKVSYARQIHPILADNCFECHSSDDHKSGLDLTIVSNLLKGGKKAGPAIVPGKPDESPLIRYVLGLRQPQMPKGEAALSEQDVHLLRSWIFAGAKDDSASVAAEQGTPTIEQPASEG